MIHRTFVAAFVLLLATMPAARGQQSTDYQITQGAVNAGGNPAGGAVLGSPGYVISLGSAGTAVSQMTIGNASLRIDGVASLEVCSGANAASCECAPPGAGLVGWWPGDGNAGDISGNRNGGTLNSGATFRPGLVKHAYRFDGVNDFVSGIGTPSTFSFIQNAGVFTIDAWIKLDDPSAPVHQTITGNTNTTAQ